MCVCVCVYIYIYECGKNNRNENFKTTVPSKNYDRLKQLQNVQFLKYLGSMLTNDGRCTCEIKSRIAMAKAEFHRKRALFNSTLDLKLRKKLVKCYIWSVALYGAETRTLRAADQTSESTSRGISYMKQVNGRLTGLVTFCVETAFYMGY